MFLNIVYEQGHFCFKKLGCVGVRMILNQKWVEIYGVIRHSHPLDKLNLFYLSKGYRRKLAQRD